RSLHLGRARFAADPRLEEAADDAIARRKLPDIWTHRLHDASTVRNWYQRKLLTRSVPALDREKVAIVQRRGFDAHQHPAWAGLRGRLVYQPESLDNRPAPAIRSTSFSRFLLLARFWKAPGFMKT